MHTSPLFGIPEFSTSANDTEGVAVTVMVTLGVATAVHPPAPVTVRLYVVFTVGLTLIKFSPGSVLVGVLAHE